MKRYAKLLAIYVLIALAVVLLYAPWGLALRPTDYDLLRAGLSIIAGVALAGVFGASTYLTLKEPDVKLLEPATVVKEEEIIPILEEYADTPHVGDIASEALEQVNSAARKRKRLHKVISVQFSEGSLSWDRFTHLVDTAQRTVLRNSALVANNIQSFDRDAYTKAKKRGDSQAQQVAVYDEALANMQEVLRANEQILLEMAKLELELSKLEADDTREAADQTIEELEGLIGETRYYR